MKMCCAFLILALASVAYGKTLEEQWADFKVKFERNYEGDEDAKRFDLFSKTVAFVDEHNAKFDKGEVSYNVGINDFADLTDEERSKRTGGKLPYNGPISSS